MESSIRVARSLDCTTISVMGIFSFGLHAAFRAAYKDENPNQIAGFIFIIDLSRTTRIDSSALGMLLLLREEHGGRNDNIRLVSANKDVAKVLKMASFDRIFWWNNVAYLTSRP
ncbi:HptB-dependent secretion and biofilm anti anti-sigma factor [Gammaproteobacteria bacterium]